MPFNKKYGLYKRFTSVITLYVIITVILIALVSAGIFLTIKRITNEKLTHQKQNLKTLIQLDQQGKKLSNEIALHQDSLYVNIAYIKANPEKIAQNHAHFLHNIKTLQGLFLQINPIIKNEKTVTFIKQNRELVFSWILYIFIFAITIYILISVFISKKMLSPIERLVDFSQFIENIGLKNNKTYIDKNDDEISHMVEKFNHLMQQVGDQELKLNQELANLKKKLDSINAKKIQNLACSIENEKVIALGALTSGIAHELNTPFAVIHSISNALENRMYDTLQVLSALFCQLDSQAQKDALSLGMKAILHNNKVVNTIEARKTSKVLQPVIEQINPALNARKIAKELATIGVDINSFKAIQNLYKTNLAEDFHTFFHLVGNSKSDVMDLQKSSSRVFHLVKSLKGYACTNYEKVNTSVAIGIQDTLTIFQHVLKSDITVTTSFTDTTPVFIHTDSLNQVWTNFINNAVDAIDGKGGIDISTKDVDDEVLIEFCDTGNGIPKATQSKIFTLNYSNKKSGSGMGIGLYKSKEIVLDHNGKISFTTSEKGTCFKVLLPKYSKQNALENKE